MQPKAAATTASDRSNTVQAAQPPVRHGFGGFASSQQGPSSSLAASSCIQADAAIMASAMAHAAATLSNVRTGGSVGASTPRSNAHAAWQADGNNNSALRTTEGAYYFTSTTTSLPLSSSPVVTPGAGNFSVTFAHPHITTTDGLEAAASAPVASNTHAASSLPQQRRRSSSSTTTTLDGAASQSDLSATTSPSSPGELKRRVPHRYQDYSRVPDVVGYIRKKTGGVTQPFPEKLMIMLDETSQDPALASICSWLSHGRAFIVRKPMEFTQLLMHK